MSTLILNSEKQFMKLKAGQTVYEVNPYGTLDPANLEIKENVITGKCEMIDNDLRWNTKSYNIYASKYIEQNRFVGDALNDGKFYTTSRKKAESYIKLLQTIGYYQLCLLRHNEWVNDYASIRTLYLC